MILHAIILGEKAKAPLHYIETVEAIEGKGLKGDRYFYKQGTFNKPQLSQNVREISIIPYETLLECNKRLKTELNFLDLRRNLVIKDFSIEALGNKVFHIGTAQFKIVRTCPPCRYLSRLLDEDIITGLKYVGGYRAEIVKSGLITIGDKIIIEGRK